MSHDITDLDLPGAQGTVQIRGAQGIFYSILLDGEPVSRTKGAWRIPMRGGDVGELRSTGILPGFQKLGWQGEEVFAFGSHASPVERAVMFAPLLLAFIGGLLGLILGLVLFFMSVRVVKLEPMPRALRIALPLINTAAGVMILLLIPSIIGAA
ncbi:hypothetical protein [Demequina globuliformis]|uniref:hypothetical protein n=1 Tax=Demequina globuliformis TaxID=676202 RepID=UPI0007840CFB|nr:hypothetical protein [Demequina globuliformis]